MCLGMTIPAHRFLMKEKGSGHVKYGLHIRHTIGLILLQSVQKTAIHSRTDGG